MAMTQAERDRKSRKKRDALGFSKICVVFPEKYRHHLELYTARKRREWEIERDGK